MSCYFTGPATFLCRERDIRTLLLSGVKETGDFAGRPNNSEKKIRLFCVYRYAFHRRTQTVGDTYKYQGIHQRSFLLIAQATTTATYYYYYYYYYYY